MSYAVLQKNLEAPSAERLRRAFRAVPRLVDGDAASLAKDAFGILVDGLSFEEATHLRQALQEEGIETEVVEQKHLIQLPPARKLHRADCTPRTLVVYDQLDRRTEIEWRHVILIAAGRVRLTEFRRVERERVVYRRGPRGGAFPVIVTDASHREERGFRLVAEVFLDVPPARYHVDAGGFRYNYLGPRLQSDRTRNFILLVRDLLSHATGAVANRGAELLRKRADMIVQYPTRHAFEEEIVWSLWQSGRGGRSAR